MWVVASVGFTFCIYYQIDTLTDVRAKECDSGFGFSDRKSETLSTTYAET